MEQCALPDNVIPDLAWNRVKIQLDVKINLLFSKFETNHSVVLALATLQQCCLQTKVSIILWLGHSSTNALLLLSVYKTLLPISTWCQHLHYVHFVQKICFFQTFLIPWTINRVVLNYWPWDHLNLGLFCKPVGKLVGRKKKYLLGTRFKPAKSRWNKVKRCNNCAIATSFHTRSFLVIQFCQTRQLWNQ